ncbi:MAG: hypothetical protein RR400_04445 [Clostridia bacterium]
MNVAEFEELFNIVTKIEKEGYRILEKTLRLFDENKISECMLYIKKRNVDLEQRFIHENKKTSISEYVVEKRMEKEYYLMNNLKKISSEEIAELTADIKKLEKFDAFCKQKNNCEIEK